MYALAIIRYRKPIEDVQKHVDAHRAYCQGLKQEGLLLASGPLAPRNGGAMLLRVPDDEAQATLDSIRDNDPYTRFGRRAIRSVALEPCFRRGGPGPPITFPTRVDCYRSERLERFRCSVYRFEGARLQPWQPGRAKEMAFRP